MNLKSFLCVYNKDEKKKMTADVTLCPVVTFFLVSIDVMGNFDNKIIGTILF